MRRLDFTSPRVLSSMVGAVVLTLNVSCGGGGASGSSVNTASAVAAAKAVAQSATTAPTTWPGPTSGPKPIPGKTIAILSCGQAATGCSVPTFAAQDAASRIGWKGVIYDTEGQQAKEVAAVNAAIDARSDAILLMILNPDLIGAPIQRALAMHIPVVTLAVPPYSSDYQKKWAAIPDMSANWHQQGVLIANYMIWKSNGHLDTLMTYLPDNIADTVGQYGGGHEVLTNKTKCPDCTVHVQTVTEATLPTATGPGTVAAVQADPKIDWLYLFDYGLGLQFNALQTAGLLRPDIKGAGFDCLAQNLSWIKQGYHQAVCLADPRMWEAWAAVDAANRMMQGQKPYTLGHLAGTPSSFPNYDVPLLLVDKNNIGSLSADDLANGWQGGAIDFRSHYLKIWGVQ